MTVGSIVQAIRRIAAITLAVVTGIMICWSLYWVATRPLRAEKGREGKIELTIIHCLGIDLIKIKR